jgi:hypothetical protein
MTVLIANVNKDIILELYPKAKFEPSSTNTSTFKIGDKSFIKLRQGVRDKGINPYALMSW